MTDNSKKKVTSTINDMITKVEAYLLNNAGSRAEFLKLLKKAERDITSLRGKDSPLKRVYSVELEAKYNFLKNIFDGTKINDENIGSKMRDPSFTPALMFSYKNFSGVDLNNLFSAQEIDTFSYLKEDDMKNNIYLPGDGA